MTTMYALPSLTTWHSGGDVGSWSNTSGGASNSTFPGSNDDVIFDGNSGVARAITLTDDVALGGIYVKSITTTSWAAGGSFTGDRIFHYDGTSNFTGVTNINALQIFGTTANINPGGVVINQLYFNTGGVLTLSGDLNVNSSVIINESGATLNANGYNVTLSQPFYLIIGTVTMGTGTWTLTGSGDVWNMDGGTLTQNSAGTIKLTNNGSTDKTFHGGSSNTYGNLWNATQGSGKLYIAGSNTYNDFKSDAGRTNNFPASTTNTVASFTADGTGNAITVQSASGGASATLAKSGGGSVYLDYCTVKDITGSPAATWNARNSTNVSGNTNVTFISGNSAFLQFF